MKAQTTPSQKVSGSCKGEARSCRRTSPLIRLELVGVATLLGVALLVPLLLRVPAVLLLPIPLLRLRCRRAQAPTHPFLVLLPDLYHCCRNSENQHKRAAESCIGPWAGSAYCAGTQREGTTIASS